MKKLSTVFALCLFVPMLGACTPSPEKLCDHAFEIIKKEAGDKAADMPEEDLKKAKEKCVKDVEKDKAEKPDEYKEKATCFMAAKDMESMGKCDKKSDK